MKRYRLLAVLMVLGLVAAACSRDDDTATTTETETTTAAANPACEGVTLEATDTGVTADEITIQVMADTGSPLAPGLFQGNVDAIEAFAEFVNANGGVGCRDLKVETWDSKLTPDEAKNGQIQACTTALAAVGGNSLFNPDVTEMNTCADSTGAAHRHPEHLGAGQRHQRAVRHELVHHPGHRRDLRPRRHAAPSGERPLICLRRDGRLLPDRPARAEGHLHGAGRSAHHRAVGHLPDLRPGRGRGRLDRGLQGVGSLRAVGVHPARADGEQRWGQLHLQRLQRRGHDQHAP